MKGGCSAAQGASRARCIGGTAIATVLKHPPARPAPLVAAAEQAQQSNVSHHADASAYALNSGT